MNDTYTWKVIYEDKTETSEFDSERPDGRGFAEREAKKVIMLLLFKENVEMHNVLIPEHAEPVFFRRRSIVFEDETNSVNKTIHCIGWRNAIDEVYLFVDDFGATLLTNDFQIL